MIDIRVQAEAFDPAAELTQLGPAGAISSFVGSVRADGDVVALEIERFAGMTESALRAIAAEAESRWPVQALTIVHRFGKLMVGEQIVFVGAASAHRTAALECPAFIVDRLKVAAPFWKKEHFADGGSRWVEACHGDEKAAARWN